MDYAALFLSKPITEVYKLFLLGMARMIPIIALAPFLGAKLLPDTMKMGFGVVLAALFLPLLIVQSGANPVPWGVGFVFLAIKEVLIGALLGFLVTIPFYAVQGSGVLIDHQRGAQSLQINDPTLQTQISPIGLLYNNMMVVVFFSLGGPMLFFEALVTAYKVIPADQFFDPAIFSMQKPLWALVVKLMGMVIAIAVQLSAPSVLAMLMTDLFLGIANRMAPQVQISFLLMSLKAVIGILLLWAGWWFILKQFGHYGLSWIDTLTRLMTNL